jgi:hypothetical protein
LPAGNSAAHHHRLLDALALLPDAGMETLETLLDGKACRRFGDGLQLIITTDRANGRWEERTQRGRRRQVITLPAAAYGLAELAQHRGLCPEREDQPRAVPPRRLLITDPAETPQQIRGLWKELLCAN